MASRFTPNFDPDSEFLSVARRVEYKYTYPNGLDLRPTSELHRRIVANVMGDSKKSHDKMSARHESWRKIDETQTAFIEPDAAEMARQERDERKPVSIVFPASTAILDTWLTYWTTAALEMPIHRYEGQGPEDTMGAILGEKIIELQSVRYKHSIPLFVMFRDASLYGFGAVATQWNRNVEKKVRPIMQPFMGQMVEVGQQDYLDVLYEGNRIDNIDPYHYLPDPNMPVHRIQDGEFVGWWYRTNVLDLMTQEEDPGNGYFNVRYLAEALPSRSSIATDSSGRNTRSGMSDEPIGGKSLDVTSQYRKLIPKAWGLGDRESPEIWHFEIGADNIVVRAERLREKHKMFPVSVIAPNFDGYSISPISRLETVYPLQHVLDFLINQKIANLLRAGNSQLIADPKIMNMDTVMDPDPGRVMLLAQDFWGRQGMMDAGIRQLNFHDAAQNNIQDAGFMMQMMERASAATDSVQGIVRPGSERRTATEVGGAHQAAVNRLQTAVQMASTQGLIDIGLICFSNTQQFMARETYVKTTGRWEQDLRAEFNAAPHVLVNPRMLDVYYDVVPRTGAIPGGTNVRAFMEWFQLMVGNPTTAQHVDILRASKHIARESGAKNVDDFLRPIETMVQPDDQVANDVQAGNLIPAPGIEQMLAGVA